MIKNKHELIGKKKTLNPPHIDKHWLNREVRVWKFSNRNLMLDKHRPDYWAKLTSKSLNQITSVNFAP